MRWWTVLTALAVCGGCTMNGDGDEYRRAVDAWHAARVARLTAPDGWLALAGLFWLSEGPSTFGSDPANELDFPASAPPRIGTFFRRGREVELRLEPALKVTAAGEPVTATRMMLSSDAAGSPTVLTLGSLSFFVIERGDRVGVRLRDADSPARARFTGIPRYPVQPVWRIVGRFERYDPPRELAVPTVLGTVEPSPCPGAVVFNVDGATQRLDAVLEKGEKELFIIFADATSGRETYGPGRFLYVPLPDADGAVVLDFNKAHNPPCAFTPYATCPLPPPGNRLPLAVRAGEKKVGDH